MNTKNFKFTKDLILASISLMVVYLVVLFPSSTISESVDCDVYDQYRAKIDHTPIVIEHAEDTMIVQAAKVIMKHEGFSATPYKCTSGKWTQGYGRRIYTKDKSSITKAKAVTWLYEDLKRITASLDRNFPWWRKLDSVRQQAMINFTYNVGIRGVYKFQKFRAAMRMGDFELAAHELKYTGERKTGYFKAVKTRAVQVANAFKYGTWNLT
jgi:lysozyme